MELSEPSLEPRCYSELSRTEWMRVFFVFSFHKTTGKISTIEYWLSKCHQSNLLVTQAYIYCLNGKEVNIYSYFILP